MRPARFREFWEFTVEKVAVNAVMAGARAGISAGDPGARRERHHARGRAAPPRSPPSPWSTARSATRSAWMPASACSVPTTTPTPPSAAPSACCRRICRAARCRASPTWASLGNWYCLQRGLSGERGAQPVGAAARAVRLQADRQHRQRVLRRLVHACRLRSARDLAGEDAALPDGDRAPQSAAAGARPDRRARLRRARLRHQAEADRLVRRERPHAGARVLGQSVDPDAGAPARGGRRRAVRDAG